MTDRIDPPADSTSRGTTGGPWPPVTDLTRIYDHGRDRCVHRDAHPDEHDGYPAASHIPASECRTREFYLDADTDASTGPAGERDHDGAALSVYCATAFQFGQPRASAGPSTPRLVLETSSNRPAAGDERTDSGRTSSRVALSLGEALTLARLIEHLVETVWFHP